MSLAQATPRYDPTINLGHLISATIFLSGLVGTIWWGGGKFAETDLKIAQLQVDIAKINADTAVRVNLYVPKIEALQDKAATANQRIENIIDANQQRDKKIDKLIDLVTQSAIDIATIKAKVDVDHPSQR